MKVKPPPTHKNDKKEIIKKLFLSDCKKAGLPEPVLEYKFHPERRFRVDYYFPSLKLACEQEGAIWTGGRHTHPVGFLKDKEKYNFLTLFGIWLLRFTPKEMTDGTATSKIMVFSQKKGV